jgi:hypothetical protein
MPYLVRAEVEKPGSGTFRTEAETKRDAIKKARFGPKAFGFSSWIPRGNWSMNN